MKCLFASDSFKGSLTSEQTAKLLTLAAKEVFGADCVCDSVPVADGGEGTVDAVIAAEHGEKIYADVHDPLMRNITAQYGICGSRAIIEMAAASGLTLLSPELRDPRLTTTYGTGELILDALNRGCREIAVAIGGSATNDGGMGCAKALGARFLDERGNELDGCGKDLSAVASIDLSRLDSRLGDTAVTVLCDVKNPLCGKMGASEMFAAQKGATPEMIAELERGMCRYRDLILRQFGVDCDKLEGAGAAGGLGAGLSVFLGGRMQPGIETVLRLIRFDERLEGVDLVVTGEGRTDAQSRCGKVMMGVGMHAKAKGIPAVGLSGSLGDGAETILDCGITALMATVNRPMTLEEAIHDAPRLYLDAARNLFRLIKIKV